MCYLTSFWILYIIDSITTLYSFCIFICIWIILLLFFFLLTLRITSFIYYYFSSAMLLDTFWFILASFFSFILLLRLCLLLSYFNLNYISFDLCKCIAYQWYWIYYIFNNQNIFSNLLLESDYYIGDIRLLQCNHVLNLLSLVIYKFWLTAIDVIHSFTITSIGIKVEIPGRCNEIFIYSSLTGMLYGQCSELCGVLHGFMPIVLFFI